MPPPLSDAQRGRIQLHLHNRLDVASIAKLEGVGKATISRIIGNLRKFGTHTAPPPPLIKKGRPFAIPPAARDRLKEFVETNPEAFLYEMQYDLYDRFNLVFSQPTISRTLYYMKICRKGSAAKQAQPPSDRTISANHSP